MSGEFDPLGALRVLTEHGVRFVVVGGFAAALYGSPSVTTDLDLCHARDGANLEALATALRSLHARLRGVDQAVPFHLDAETLRAGGSFTFSTDVGALDILAEPAGTTGYEQLRRTATTMDLGDLDVLVAGMDELIVMKRSAGRPKDRVELEILGALREVIDGMER